MADYPEHEKQAAVLGKAAVIGDFLDWCGEQGIRLAHYVTWEDHDPTLEFHPGSSNPTNLLAHYFDIDLSVIEAEKRAMLEALRAQH